MPRHLGVRVGAFTFPPDPSRVLRLYDQPLMVFGAAIPLSTTPTTGPTGGFWSTQPLGEAQAKALYYEVLFGRAGTGSTAVTSAAAAAYRGARGVGAPPGKLVQYDLTGAVTPSWLQGPPAPPVLGAGGVSSGAGGTPFVDPLLNPAGYFLGTASRTGTTSSGSRVITAMSSTAGLYNGAPITGPGIPAGATCSSFVANTSITVDAGHPAGAGFGTGVVTYPDNTIPDDLFIWEQASAPFSGTPYTDYTGFGGAPSVRIWDSRWINYSVAHAVAVMTGSYFDGYQTDISGRIFVDQTADGSTPARKFPYLSNFTFPTGTTHLSTTIDGLSSMLGLAPGLQIAGAGIPANTTISSVNIPGNSIVISNAATVAASGVQLTIGIGYGSQQAPFYVTAMAAYTAAIQAALGGSAVTAYLPNYSAGYKTFAQDGGPISLIRAGTAGGEAQDFMRNKENAVDVFNKETKAQLTGANKYGPNWQQDIDAILDDRANGKVSLPYTQLWPSVGPGPITCVQSMQWHRLWLGSLLLASDGGPCFGGFRHDDTVSGSVTVVTTGTTLQKSTVTGTATTFTKDLDASHADISAKGVYLVTLIGGVQHFDLIKNVQDDLTLILAAPYGGTAGTTGNWATTSPMNGRQHQFGSHYYTDVPDFPTGVWSGPNPDQHNWWDRLLNPDGTFIPGLPVDYFTYDPVSAIGISAQRHAIGGAGTDPAYYLRRFSRTRSMAAITGLDIVNPTTADVTGLNALTAAPFTAASIGGVAGGTPSIYATGWTDVGAELADPGRTLGSTAVDITNLTIHAHSALVLQHA